MKDMKETVARSEPLPPGGLSTRAILAGLGASLVTALACSVLVALIFYTVDLTPNYQALAVSLINGLSFVVGGAYAGRSARSLGWLHGAVTAGLFVLLALVFALVVFPGLPGWLILFRRLAVALAVGALAGIIGVNL